MQKQEFGSIPPPQYPPIIPPPVPLPSYSPLPANYAAPLIQSVPYETPAYLPPLQPLPLPIPVSNYSQPLVVSNYSTSYTPSYAPIQTTSYAPVPTPSYSPPPVVKIYQPTVNYSTQIQLPVALTNKYSIGDLAPFVPFNGYRANHWSLFYYRASPYRSCPKNIYLSLPSYKDIEGAFAFALSQLNLALNANIQYLNSSAPSWAARHQVFSFLSQQNARMDEEGLLLELVSQYLAERICLTKWDKQRYLPQLTKLVSVTNFPGTHSCSNYYTNQWQGSMKYCVQNKYRTFDGFCNNPYHPYWGKSNVCHIRLLSPDYADGISYPRTSYNPRFPLPNARYLSNIIHSDIPIWGPYNLLKMQWGQFINHDITNTALSAYEGLVDCCKNPKARGCWPIQVPPGDRFYGPLNVTCLSFIRSGVCPLCQLGPRQQLNRNTAFLDASHIYGNTPDVALSLRAFRGGLLKISLGQNGEVLLPLASGNGQEQCTGICYKAGDLRVNQHPALTALHTLMLRRHNIVAQNLALRHPNYSDEILFQEARRLVIAEYQMITYGEYLPIVFGPILTAYYKLLPQGSSTYTYYDSKADPTTWNEYSTATCRFGHSQIASTFGLYSKIFGYNQQQDMRGQGSYRLKEWYMRPSILAGNIQPIMNGLLSTLSMAVDPWVSTDVRDHLYQGHKDRSGGDLAATNIWRGRDHGIPGYVHYIEYCFNYKVRGWKDLAIFIPYYTLNQLKRAYKVVENVDLWTGGMAERHFPGADVGPTFACVNGIQYYHLKFGDRFWFEHGNQVGSFNPIQLAEIKRSTLARFLCTTAYLPAVPQYAFLQPNQYNPLVNCSLLGDIDYSKF